MALLYENCEQVVKVYFWDGSEFKNTAAPCCEVHAFGQRLKFLVIGRNSTKLFCYEEGIMSILKRFARKILKEEIATEDKNKELMISWVIYHRNAHELERNKLITRKEWDKLVESSSSIAAMRRHLEHKGTIR